MVFPTTHFCHETKTRKETITAIFVVEKLTNVDLKFFLEKAIVAIKTAMPML